MTPTSSIQRQAGTPNQSPRIASPAGPASAASDSNARKMPSVIANCCRELKAPRIFAGAISPM